MPYKFCVRQSKSNYLSEEKKKEKFCQFPLEEERKKWIRAIPCEGLVINTNSWIYRYHWHLNCKSIISNRGNERPFEQPFTFDGILTNCLASPSPKSEKNVSASCSSSIVISDELVQFQEADNLVYGDVIKKARINYDLIVFEQGLKIIIQSRNIEMVYQN